MKWVISVNSLDYSLLLHLRKIWRNLIKFLGINLFHITTVTRKENLLNLLKFFPKNPQSISPKENVLIVENQDILLINVRKNYSLPPKIDNIFQFEHQSFNFYNPPPKVPNFFNLNTKVSIFAIHPHNVPIFCNMTNIIPKFPYCPYIFIFFKLKK